MDGRDFELRGEESKRHKNGKKCVKTDVLQKVFEKLWMRFGQLLVLQFSWDGEKPLPSPWSIHNQLLFRGRII